MIPKEEKLDLAEKLSFSLRHFKDDWEAKTCHKGKTMILQNTIVGVKLFKDSDSDDSFYFALYKDETATVHFEKEQADELIALFKDTFAYLEPKMKAIKVSKAVKRLNWSNPFS